MGFGKRAEGGQEAAGADKRAALRGSVGVAGKALFADTTKDCTVIDISRTGARLRLNGFTALPDKFELYIPERQRSSRVTVQWRAGDEVGVQFDASASRGLSDGHHELLTRIEKLEATVAALQRIVTERLEPRDPKA